MAARGVIIGLASAVLLFCFLESCYANVILSTLPRTLIVTTTTSNITLKATKDPITVSWSLNATSPAGVDATYKTIKTKLCYTKISQKDRGWRKTVDDLKKDKTCQFQISSKPYSSANSSGTATWIVEAKIPKATYFIRAYAFDAAGIYVGYGETSQLTTNIHIEAVTGRHASLDIASIVFSVFSVVSLAFFFFIEKKKANKAT